MFCSLDNTADKTIENALLAQLVEHLTLNQGVQGSSPWRRIAEHCFWDVEPGGGVLFCLPIQSHAHARKYAPHACMMAHISVHVYGEKPYMSKSKASKRRFCECGSE